MSAVVLLSVERGVATISLNRPQVLNAMDGEMMQQLRPIAESVQNDPAVRAVVVRGEVRPSWPARRVGIHSHLGNSGADRALGREMHFAFLALRRMGKPVLASVHGAVAGAGFSLLCAADLAIAAAEPSSLLPTPTSAPAGRWQHPFPAAVVGYRRRWNWHCCRTASTPRRRAHSVW